MRTTAAPLSMVIPSDEEKRLIANGMARAGALARCGHEVLIVDADPPGPATRQARTAERSYWL